MNAVAPGRALRLAYYGDDLTGSAAVMETLAFEGIRSVLFFEPPDAAALARRPGIGAVGVAGVSRAMKTAAMDSELRRVFSALKSLHPVHFLYKICSTFDSSPGIGSIGRAIDIGAEIFPSPFVPVIGSFMEPRILGGAKGATLGMTVDDQFTSTGNWPLGAAISFSLLALVALIFAVIYGLVWLYRAWQSSRYRA